MSNDGKPYDVGYKKPPVSKRFVKGQSGNPNGRARETKNIPALFEELLKEEITITEGGKEKTIQTQEAIARRVRADALKGKEKAIERILSYAPKNEDEEKRYTLLEWADIRDKIAASKQKGMWMGGNPPVGYEIKDRRLVVNKDEAKIALHLFERYRALGCVSGLKKELDGNHILSRKRRTAKGNSVGGGRYSRGALYAILQNPVYIGKIRHKEKTYDGQHNAIIPEDLWNDVQKLLKNGGGVQRGTVKPRLENLLKGLLFDCDGTRYSPVRAKKGEKKAYRYYISQNLLQYRDHPKGVMARLPAYELEQTIGKAVQKNVFDILGLKPTADYREIEHIKRRLPEGDELVESCVQKITVGQEVLDIEISSKRLRGFLEEKLNLAIPSKSGKQPYILSAPFSTTRANKGAIIMSPKNGDHDPLDLPPHQLRNLVRGIVWRDEHFDGMSIEDIAVREGLSKSGIRKIIMGSFDTLMAL